MSAWIKIKECDSRGGILGGNAANSQGFKIQCALQNETMHVRYATISSSLQTYNFVTIIVSFQVSIKIYRKMGPIYYSTENNFWNLFQICRRLEHEKFEIGH